MVIGQTTRNVCHATKFFLAFIFWKRDVGETVLRGTPGSVLEVPFW